MFISSKTNPKYKQLLQLCTSRGRKQSSQFIIEGQRELSRAIQANVKIEYAVFSQTSYQQSNTKETFPTLLAENRCLVIPDDMFAHLSVRENPAGIMGIANTWNRSLKDAKLKTNGLYLLVEQLEKPGNLGALMRSAEATAVDGFFIANPVVDIFNPNVIRASQGAVFNLNIYWDTSENLFQFFKKNSVEILATTPHTDCMYWDCDMTQTCVICVGSEAFGLSDLWMNQATKMVIPMYGDSADSLNASVSGSLCLYEARRQRHFKNL